MPTTDRSRSATLAPLEEAPYDELYRRSGLLWPARPGRMVHRIADLLAPGRCLDLGCGDGKNLVYLEQLGWHVDGVDLSPLALAGASERVRRVGLKPRGTMVLGHSGDVRPERNAYDIVVAYGLFHCLDEGELTRTAGRVIEALRPNGYLVFAAFNDNLPVPQGHGTGTLYLRPQESTFHRFRSWERCAVEYGTIEEEHRPVVGLHQHSLTWGILRKC